MPGSWIRTALVTVSCVTWLTAGSVRAQVAQPPLGLLEQQLSNGDYDRAERGLRERALAEPDARLPFARLLFETGRYADASTQAEMAAAQPALASAATTLLGEVSAAQGRLDEAERLLRNALVSDPAALRPRLLLGRLLWDRGQRDSANELFEALLREGQRQAALPLGAEALSYVAMAARALGRTQYAAHTFQEAAERDHSRIETQLETAKLFLDKADWQQAADYVRAALVQNPNSASAWELSARLAILQLHDFAAAEQAITRALAVNPQLVAAHVTRAALALRDLDIERAEAALRRALAINPNHLEARALQAAARFLDDDQAGFAAEEQAVLAINPRYSRFYGIVAEHAEWEHRYPEVVKLLRRALRIDPDDAAARGMLGLALLRMGRERAGLRELEKARTRDHFSAQVVNTLNLYQRAIRSEYVEDKHGPFRIRLHKSERAILQPYLVPLLQRAYADMRARYAFTPEGPLYIELYADRAQFSVRTTGMPNVGVQGASFGKVVTGLSPRGGPFNWGQIVWHELSHVFHLQLSKNRVPRWFTEGLAEYETVQARPEWKREDDYALWQAMRAGRLPPLAAMNQAFTRVQSSEELLTSYYLAYRVVQYFADRFGFERVRGMLVAFGEGKKLPEVVHSVLGVPLDEIDRDFRADLQRRLAKYDREFAPDPSTYSDLTAARALALRAPTDPDVLAALAMAEVLSNHMEAGARAARSAIKIAPKHAIAHFALARVALARHDARKAERCLLAIVNSGADGYTLRLLLARAALARAGARDALQQAEAAVLLDPDRPEAYRLMLEIATQLNDEALTLRALRALAGLDQHDGTLHAAYLALLTKTGAYREAVIEGEAAVHISPELPGLHLHLGEAYVETGAAARGLVELERALQLGYSEPGVVRLWRARAFLQLKDRTRAKRELRAALIADPSLAARATQD